MKPNFFHEFIVANICTYVFAKYANYLHNFANLYISVHDWYEIVQWGLEYRTWNTERHPNTELFTIRKLNKFFYIKWSRLMAIRNLNKMVAILFSFQWSKK